MIGFLDIDWNALIADPGKWLSELREIDGPEDLKRKKKISSFGQIQIQMMFEIPDCYPDDPPAIEYDYEAERAKEEERRK